MNKKVIFLAQLSHQNGAVFQNRCFPLGIGYMASYILSVFEYQFAVDLFKSPEDFNEALECSNPDIVMLSCHMWNENLTLTFANKIKKK